MERVANLGVYRRLLILGAFLGFLGIAFGAFGSHMLREQLPAHLNYAFDIAVRYQLLHAVAIIAVALAGRWVGSTYFVGACAMWISGTVLFSGSLYYMTFTGSPQARYLTLLGGVFLLAGWGYLMWGAWKAE